MSGTSYYYSSSSPSSSSSRNHPPHESQLPPLRTVLGEQLDLPVHGSRYSSTETYDSHSSHRDQGFSSGSQYTSHSTSSTGTYRDSYGHYHSDPSMAHSYSQMNKEDTKKYTCTWAGCGKRFERQNALDTHMNIHTDMKPFACPVANCGKVFNVRSNMRRHILTHKGYVDPNGDYFDQSQHKYTSSSSSPSTYYSSR